MNSTRIKTWLLNPFTYIAGGKALLIGWIIMLATAGIAYHTLTHFDGTIDAHWGSVIPPYGYLLEPLISWTSAAIAFYIAGRIFSRTTVRPIDIAGTMALARWPMIFVALINFGMRPVDVTTHIPLSLIGVMLADVVFAVWMIALMYHAFAISANLKGRKGAFVFIGALLAAELLSKGAFYILYKHII